MEEKTKAPPAQNTHWAENWRRHNLPCPQQMGHYYDRGCQGLSKLSEVTLKGLWNLHLHWPQRSHCIMQAVWLIPGSACQPIWERIPLYDCCCVYFKNPNNKRGPLVVLTCFHVSSVPHQGEIWTISEWDPDKLRDSGLFRDWGCSARSWAL